MLTVVVLYISIKKKKIYIYQNDVLGRFGLCHIKIVHSLLLKKKKKMKRKKKKKKKKRKKKKKSDMLL